MNRQFLTWRGMLFYVGLAVLAIVAVNVLPPLHGYAVSAYFGVGAVLVIHFFRTLAAQTGRAREEKRRRSIQP